jgi:hypothetical protein
VPLGALYLNFKMITVGDEDGEGPKGREANKNVGFSADV